MMVVDKNGAVDKTGNGLIEPINELQVVAGPAKPSFPIWERADLAACARGKTSTDSNLIGEEPIWKSTCARASHG
jgi:hypothetical protein